jgi:hypothetical protein
MPMLLGGDFRQIPPVLRRIDSEAFPAHTLKACAFWSDRQATRTYQLTENKRAEQDPWYAAFVLSVGDGTHLRDAATDSVDGLHPAAVSVPSCLAAPDDSSVEDLVAWTYPDFASIIDLPLQDQLDYFGERVIVTPTNAAANALNEYILSLMPGLCKTYTSYDSIIEGDASAEHSLLARIPTHSGLQRNAATYIAPSDWRFAHRPPQLRAASWALQWHARLDG